MANQNRYSQIIEGVFLARYTEGVREIDFEREDFGLVAQELNITPPKNLGDILYSFRYRTTLPKAVRDLAPEGFNWIIRPAGRGQYRFVLTALNSISPNRMLAETKIPDATPGLVTMYSLNDEQALLARLRYNRLVDVFTGVTCYSLQNHLRTSVPLIGQVETDEVYVGVDRRGVHYVFPIQAKGGRDTISVVQIEQDFALCQAKFPLLVCRPVAAQFMQDELIALFEFEETSNGIAMSAEKHYRLVAPDQISVTELETYRTRQI